MQWRPVAPSGINAGPAGLLSREAHIPVSTDLCALNSWFGIRGIGSIYYLMFALDQGVSRAIADRIIALTLTMVALFIVVHRIPATPMMTFHSRHEKKRHHKAPENARPE